MITLNLMAIKNFLNYITIPKILNNEKSAELFLELMVITITYKI